MTSLTTVTLTTPRPLLQPDLYQTYVCDKTYTEMQPRLQPSPAAANVAKVANVASAANSERCPVCNVAALLPAEKAAAICQCSRRQIYRWIEDGWLHCAELLDGTVLVCGRALAAGMEALEETTAPLPPSRLNTGT